MWNSIITQPFLINVDVSASTAAFVGTVRLIAVRRSVSGRTGCRRCGRVGKTSTLIKKTLCNYRISYWINVSRRLVETFEPWLYNFSCIRCKPGPYVGSRHTLVSLYPCCHNVCFNRHQRRCMFQRPTRSIISGNARWFGHFIKNTNWIRHYDSNSNPELNWHSVYNFYHGNDFYLTY